MSFCVVLEIYHEKCANNSPHVDLETRSCVLRFAVQMCAQLFWDVVFIGKLVSFCVVLQIYHEKCANNITHVHLETRSCVLRFVVQIGVVRTTFLGCHFYW